MNYTENYRLNQWDPEDRLLREDFNRDNANVESGLTTLKQGLETETQSREAAVTAAKQEAAQAVNAAKQEASQALAAATGALESSKADKTALAQLQTQVDARSFVKLREVAISESVNQVDVDVSDIRLDQYLYLLFVPELYISNAEENLLSLRFYVRLNGISEKIYASQGNSASYFMGETNIHDTYSKFELMQSNGAIKGLEYSTGSRGNGYLTGMWADPEALAASQLQSVNFTAEDPGLIRPGGKIYVYGVKR